MKKNFLAVLFALALCSPTFAQWKPAGDKIKTPWGEQLNPKNVLPEYPRPIMERHEWKNLNGSWNYAITKKGEAAPGNYQGEILVPFAVESSLSGVGKRINEHQELWYQRTFDVPSSWKGKQILLHFGAVDWKADVWVNDVKVGEHTGGFTPFYFDITSALNKGNNQLVVKVWDPADRGEQPRGKQVPAAFVSVTRQPTTETEVNMAIINLRDYYPFYTSDCFMEVSEEVAEMFKEFDRKEAAYRLRTYRHKAYYSLDRDDGLEHEAVFVALSPHELYERKVTMQELHAAIASLPDKQAKRIYAHFILGMTKQDIARAEGVHEKVVRVAIERGLRHLEKILKNSL